MEIIDLGVREYRETWQLQRELVERRADDKIPDTLVLVEHPAVFTVGRGEAAPGAEIRVRRLGAVPVVEIERGGKMTFHGPGQLVGYPIFGLVDRDLRYFLRETERILMTTVAERTMLPARPCPETLVLEPDQVQTGVWIRDRKVASIGIAVRKWVTYHGFALNLSTDLRYFGAIEPCGFAGDVMTTLEREMGPDANIAGLRSALKRDLVTRFEALSARYASIPTGATRFSPEASAPGTNPAEAGA